MTTQEIANRLVELCRQGKFEEAQETLYAEDAISIEPYATPAFEKETKGLKAIHEKTVKWEQMLEEAHAMEISAPLIAASSFAVTMHMDITVKGKGRIDMTELCVYEVKNGKIISERFFE